MEVMKVAKDAEDAKEEEDTEEEDLMGNVITVAILVTSPEIVFFQEGSLRQSSSEPRSGGARRGGHALLWS